MAQMRGGRQRFRTVHFHHHSPPQLGEIAPCRHAVDPGVVAYEPIAMVAGQRLLHRQRGCLERHPVAIGGVPDMAERSRVKSLGAIALRQNRFARAAETGAIGRDRLQLVHIQPQGQHADERVLVQHGRGQEGCGPIPGRRIRCELREAGLQALQGQIEPFCQRRAAVCAGQEIGAEVGLVPQGKNHVACRVHQQEIVEIAGLVGNAQVVLQRVCGSLVEGGVQSTRTVSLLQLGQSMTDQVSLAEQAGVRPPLQHVTIDLIGFFVRDGGHVRQHALM